MKIKTCVPLFLTILSLCIASPFVQAREVDEDPLDSVMWQAMVDRFMPDGDVVFDGKVRLLAPQVAEDQFHVPVTVDAGALDDVEEIIALADLNPIPLILRVRPHEALPYVAFRVKLQQTSPVHVAAKTADGVWHVSGQVIDAAGGGCTAPAAAHGNSNWMRSLGETRVFVARESDSVGRLTVRMRHPMDTGLAAGIPAFYLSEMRLSTPEGESIADVELYEPISENPTITLRPRISTEQSLEFYSRDTEGNEFDFPLTFPATQSL